MPLFAQVTDSTIVVPPVGEGFGFGTLIAISGMTIFLTALFNKIFKVIAPLWKQVISWVVSIGVVVVANLLGIGFAAEFTIGTTFIYGIANGLLSNGIFDISFIRLLLSLIKLNDPPVAIIEPPATVAPEAKVKGNFQK